MENISTYTLLFAGCGLVILSYFFSILNRLTRVPAVLLLSGRWTERFMAILSQYDDLTCSN